MKYFEIIWACLLVLGMYLAIRTALGWPLRHFKKARRAQNLHQKGRKAFALGDLKPASKHIFKAAKIFKKLRDFPQEADCWVDLAQIYGVGGFENEAFVFFDFAQKLYHFSDQPLDVAETLMQKARLFAGRKAFAEAEAYHRESADIFGKHKVYTRQIDALNAVIFAQIGQNNLQQARQSIRRVEKLCRKCDYPEGKALLLMHEAYLFLTTRQYTKSLALAEQSVQLYRQKKNASGVAESSFVAAYACYRLKQYQRAEKFCRRIEKNISSDTLFFRRPDVDSLRGLIALDIRKHKSALVFFERAYVQEMQAQNLFGALSDSQNAEKAARLLGQKNKAEEYRTRTEEILYRIERENMPEKRNG